ncbi:MAG TPA: DUF5050 domain-containing protein [Minicystis sp.]|nr:DUF5050 domain-containing protein [Minicystis sp.]
MKRLALALALALVAGCGRHAPKSAIAKGLSEVDDVKVDPDHVYWRGHDAVLRANKDGGDLHSILQAELTDFLVDGVAIYFTVERAGVVASLKLEGNALQQTVASKLDNPGRIAGDFVFLYVCNRDASGSVVKIPKTGGAPQVLADKQTEPQAIGVDDTFVYWGTSNGQISRVPKAGGTPQRLDADTSVVTDLSVDDEKVYWVSHFGPSTKVYAMPKAGGPKKELAAFDGDAPRLAQLGGLLFVSYEAGGKVHVASVKVDGSDKPKELGGFHGGSGGIAADPTSVFLGVRDPKGDDGWVIRLPR